MTGIALTSSDYRKREECLVKIDGASRHLLNVINDVLDMSKIEANKFELALESFDIGETIRSVLNMLDWRLGSKRREFVVNIDDIPAFLIGDNVRLSQIIVNLLSNAEKFTPEGGRVALSLRNLEEDSEACALQFEVEDSGPGISQEQQTLLFNSFQQANGGIARKFGGTGLGLAISKKLVEMMDGRIWVTSEPGKGANFAFTVRLRKEKLDSRRVDVGGILDAMRGIDALGADTGGINDPHAINAVDGIDGDIYDIDGGMSGRRAGRLDWSMVPDDVKSGKRRVLLVEDVEVNRELVTMYFENSGITFDAAENGAEAVRLFAQAPERYCLVLMDVQMPVMDGYEASRAIRAFGAQARKIPIIAMTANVFKEDIDHCFEAGMDDHVGKPIDMEVLREKVLGIVTQNNF
jgi:CheY-like chemotaxis protein/two-component sensor histidine kinase